MEVIFDKKEQGEINLPRNIRRVGREAGNRKIYIEDYAYSFIKDQRRDVTDEGEAGILLGRVRKGKKATYVFIKAALKVNNAAVLSDRIVFTEETWMWTKSMADKYFEELDIVGWYVCSGEMSEKDINVFEHTHNENFNNPDDVFFLPKLEQDEDDLFFGKNGNGLSQFAGFTIYYERNEAMQNYMADACDPTELECEDSDYALARFREIMKNRTTPEKKVKRQFTLIYSLCMLLIIVVLVIGVNRINDYDKMNSIQKDTSAAESTKDASALPQETTPMTPVVEDTSEETTTAKKEEQTTTKKEEETTTKKKEEQTTTKKEEETTKKKEEQTTTKKEEETTKKPQETTAAYQEYTVKDQDSLFAICRKFYGEEKNAYVQKILEYNGLTANDDILPGTVLKIPNLK